MMFFWTKKGKYLLFLAIGIVVLGGASGVIAFFTIKNQNKKSKINEIITADKINKESNNHKNTFYRPFQFRELEKIGKGQPIMFKGIGYDAYMFGASFLLNIAWKIGLNLFENEGEITKDGNVKNVDYYNNYNQAKIEEEKSNENPKEILKAFKSFKQHPLGHNYWKHWDVWQVFAVMDPFGIDGNLDIDLLDVGGVNHIWSFKEVGRKNGLFKFVGGIDPKQQFGAYSFWQMIDGSGPKPTQKTSPQKKGIHQDGVGVITGVNISNSHHLKGSFLSKLLNSENKLTKKGEKWSFNYHFRSIKNLRPRYVVVSQKKIEEIKMLYLAIIKNLKSYLDKNKKIAIIDNLHPIIARFFQFLRNLNVKDKKVVAKIKEAIDELNNGSHNLLSVEIFARGIKNVPMQSMPIPSNLVSAYLGLKYSKTGVGEIEGLASTNNIESTLLKMFHGTKKGYFDQEGNASTKDNLMFDPKASKSLTIIGFDFSNQRSISGQEVKLMGGLVQKKVYNKWLNDYQVWLNDKSLKKPVLKYVDENL